MTDSTMTPLQKKNIDSLTVVELKEELRSRSSPVIGRKKDLLERLKSVLAEGNEERSGQDADVVPPPLPLVIQFPSLAEPISQEADGGPVGISAPAERPDARMVDAPSVTETKNADIAPFKDGEEVKQGASVILESPDTAMADQLKPLTHSEPPAEPDSNDDAKSIPGLEPKVEATTGDEAIVSVEETEEEEEEALVQLEAPELEMQAIAEMEAMEEAQGSSKKRREESIPDHDEPAKRQRTDEAPSHNSEGAAHEPVPPVQIAPARPVWQNSRLPTANGSGAPRVVPPSPDPLSPSIRIDHLLRPFHTRTLEQLLAKTGSVEHFWIDSIKTHCYATYASEAEASATRDALFNLHWPEQGGKKLAVKFVPTAHVKTRLGLLTAPALEGGEGAEADGVASFPPVEGGTAGSGVGVGAEEKGVNGMGGAGVKEVFTVRNVAVSEPVAEETLPTLDDLFRKTKARPQVYYLPLTGDQVSTKLVAQKKTPSVQVE